MLSLFRRSAGSTRWGGADSDLRDGPLGGGHRSLLQPVGQDPNAGAVPAQVSPGTPSKLPSSGADSGKVMSIRLEQCIDVKSTLWWHDFNIHFTMIQNLTNLVTNLSHSLIYSTAKTKSVFNLGVLPQLSTKNFVFKSIAKKTRPISRTFLYGDDDNKHWCKDRQIFVSIIWLGWKWLPA